MKKIYLLAALCIVIVVGALLPTVYFMSGRYETVQFGKNLDKVFNNTFENGSGVKGDNNGNLYLISQANIPRLYEVLSFTKRPAKESEEPGAKEIIKIDIYGTAVIEVLNFDEENDITYIRMTKQGENPGKWFMTENLRLYEWVDKIISDDGITAPNKRIGK